MTRSFEQWAVSFVLAIAILILGLTMYRASCVIALRESYRTQVEALQQENITLRSRLTLYMADPETQSYLDRWFSSQARRIAENGARSVQDTASKPSVEWHFTQ